MKLGVLFSGGKDSTLALHKAAEKETIACLITVLSANPESYMFHTPNVAWTQLQAQALGLPLVAKLTEGKKEAELADLTLAISQAVEQFGIEGVVTGAVESVYQAQRVQRICHDLDLWCFNPLWKKNQKTLLEELLQKHFKVVVSGIFAYPLDASWLGKELDAQLIDRLVALQQDYGISPTGEGGEIETTVLDAPLYNQRLEIVASSKQAKDNSGTLQIEAARLIPK